MSFINSTVITPVILLRTYIYMAIVALHKIACYYVLYFHLF